MELSITGQRFDVSPALKGHVETKIKKLERHYDCITNVHVILKLEKESYIAEATVHVSGGDLFAQAAESNMYVSVDHLVAKLDSQVTRYKDKVLSRRR